VWCKFILDISAVLVDERSLEDLKAEHLKSGSNLLELDALGLGLSAVDIVPEENVVILEVEGDDPSTLLLGHREQELEDVLEPLRALRVEAVEEEVWVLLAHGAHMGDVVAQHRVVEGEEGRRAVGQVAHYQPVRCAPRFLDDDEVRAVVGGAGLDEALYAVVASIDAH